MDRMRVDGKLCYSNSTDLAHRNLSDQESSFQRHVSLHAMWRACGEPSRRSPDAWVTMARDLISGMEAYEKEVHLAFFENPECPYSPYPMVSKPISRARLKMLTESEPAPYYRVGDITTRSHEVAELYAMFLDNRGQMQCFVGGDDLQDDDKPTLSVISPD